MELNNEQKQALEQGEAVPVTVDETRCVVVREDVYERIRSLPVDYDDGDYDVSETYPAIIEVLNQEDENPEQYLEYLEDE